MDQVRQLRPGLPGGSLLRYRSGRIRELSVGLWLLLPVRSSKQDPGPRLVSAIIVPIVRTSRRVVAANGTGQHHPGMEFVLEGELPLGRRAIQWSLCAGER